MTENQKAKIDDIVQNGYDFKLGEYIGKGFNILQKELGLFILFSLLTFFIAIIVSIIPLLGWLANVLVIVPIYTVGILHVSHKIDNGEPVEFSDFFRGFDQLGQIAVAALVIFIISALFQVPAFYMNMELFEWYAEILEDPQIAASIPPPPIGFSFYLWLLPSFLVSVTYVFTFPFIWFYKMNFWDAMEASRKVTFKNFLLVFVFILIGSIIGGLGVILCCVGLLATYPAYISMIYSAFSDITKLNDDSGDTPIDQHLIVD